MLIYLLLLGLGWQWESLTTVYGIILRNQGPTHDFLMELGSTGLDISHLQRSGLKGEQPLRTMHFVIFQGRIQDFGKGGPGVQHCSV